MLFYSTNKKSPNVSLKEAVLQGLPPDNGLYMPERIPELNPSFVEKAPTLSFQEIAFEIANTILSSELPESVLSEIIDSAINFDAPLVPVADQIQTLELFHGPTLAFKDFAARFMAHLMAYYVQDSQKELNILVATSGDTGSAVASGFFNRQGIRVFVLYPSGKVSHLQEQQLTTLGGNITTLEIAGTFDDCQNLVKQAFLDEDLQRRLFLTSANSVNIARLIPQAFYYAYAWSRLDDKNHPSIFSVPSGNFGNLTAGLFAKKMGIPISHFVVSTNVNDVVPEFLQTGEYRARPSLATISNAMDVGDPSNFKRMNDLFGGEIKQFQKELTGFSFTDQQTKSAMKEVYEKHDYVLDPHGAIGYLGLQKYLANLARPATGVFLETAHPAKFIETVEETLDIKIEIPERLRATLKKKNQATTLSKNFHIFKEFLLE